MRAIYVNYYSKKIIKAEDKENLISEMEERHFNNIFTKREFLNEIYGSMVYLYEQLEKGLTFEEIQERFKKYCRTRAEYDFTRDWTREEI